MRTAERWYGMIADLYLTREETKTLKKWVFITRDLAVLLTTLISLFYVWKKESPWHAVPVFLVIVYVSHRIYRRSSRRCPHCSDLTETCDEKEVPVGKRSLFRAIFGGWFVRQNYWLEMMPKKFDSDPEVDAKIRKVLKEVYRQDPDSQHLCHFHYTCRVCDYDFAVKPPVPHSFEARPIIFRHW